MLFISDGVSWRSQTLRTFRELLMYMGEFIAAKSDPNNAAKLRRTSVPCREPQLDHKKFELFKYPTIRNKDKVEVAKVSE